jgi:hypothetical protein
VYQPIFSILKSSTPAALLSVEGAGILDYSDYPSEYPLYSAFFSGIKKARWKSEDFIQGTASIMAAFAALVIEADAQHETAFPVSRFQGSMENMYFETSKAWNLPPFGYILSP